MDAIKTYRMAAIGGDGVGPEVVDAGIEVLAACADADGGFALDVVHFDWGSDRYRATGMMMPEDGVATLRGFDAIYFGAVGDPNIPDHITLWDLRLAICQGLDQYANVRPTKLLAGMTSPLRPELAEQIDWAIVRENPEGEYAGVGGQVHGGLPLATAMDVTVFTREGVERIARYACELAMTRPRKRLTVVTKSNAQRHGMVFWDAICREVIAGYPGVEVDFKLVDAMAALMITRPGDFDTILATNLHADILSDVASALTGSLGNGATANINPDPATPSMFEPIHGSAFDIMGQKAPFPEKLPGADLEYFMRYKLNKKGVGPRISAPEAPIVALFPGDVAGIGPEQTARMLAEGKLSEIAQLIVIRDRRNDVDRAA